MKTAKNNSLEIETKKIWLLAMQKSGYSIHSVISQLLEPFHDLGVDETLLNKLSSNIAEYIFAYLDLGFSYLNHKCLFDKILMQAGYSKKELELLQTKNRNISINKAKIRSLIGRWPASPHNSHTITEAINEIISLSTAHKNGTYYFYTAKKDGSYTALYKLIITPEITIFQDVVQNLFYNLVEE